MPSGSLLKKYSFRFILFVLLIVAFIIIGNYVSVDAESYKDFLSGFPVLASGFIFIVLYAVVSSIVWVGPKDIFRIAAAVVYGTAISTILVYIGELINIIIMFTLSRRLGRGFVESKLKGNMQRLDNAIADTSFWPIFFLKFFPVVPLRFLDLGFGLTKISLKKYFVISAIASPLRILFLQFFLTLGMETVMNPYKLGEYLYSRPVLWFASFFYCFGSFGLIFWMKKRSKASSNN